MSININSVQFSFVSAYAVKSSRERFMDIFSCVFVGMNANALLPPYSAVQYFPCCIEHSNY